jgi:6,7-dimethyl-8-ribityllumazine synthase
VRVHEPLSVMDLLDVGGTTHSWSIAAALDAINEAGRGVVVLLHRPESAHELRRRALEAEASRQRQGRSARLRHRRADPARSQRRQDAAPRRAPQDAEHGGLRSRSHGLRDAAFARAGSRNIDAVPAPNHHEHLNHAHPPDSCEHDRHRPRVGIVLSRFNPGIGDLMLAGALRALKEAGVGERNITVVTVPGALETPLALQRLAQAGDFDALVALGAVIRGETYHFEIVANESARGVAELSLEFGIPIGNGILTTDTDEQALMRARKRARRPCRRRSSSRTAGSDRCGLARAARARVRAAGTLPAAAFGQSTAMHPRPARRGRRLREADAAYFDELWAGVTADYDALLEMLSPYLDRRPRSSRRSSARSSSSARGSFKRASRSRAAS